PRLQLAEGIAGLVAGYGVGFVHHDLRAGAQSVSHRRLYGDTKGLNSTQLAGYGQNRDRGEFGKEIGLDDQCGPRLAVASGQNHGYQVAAFQTQPSVSAT